MWSIALLCHILTRVWLGKDNCTLQFQSSNLLFFEANCTPSWKKTLYQISNMFMKSGWWSHSVQFANTVVTCWTQSCNYVHWTCVAFTFLSFSFHFRCNYLFFFNSKAGYSFVHMDNKTVGVYSLDNTHNVGHQLWVGDPFTVFLFDLSECSQDQYILIFVCMHI